MWYRFKSLKWKLSNVQVGMIQLEVIPLLNCKFWKRIWAIVLGFNRRWLEKTSYVEWMILVNFNLLRRSLGRFWFKCWCRNKMLKTSTMSKNLRIPRLKKIGFEGVLGALNVINLNAAFWSVRIRWEFVLSQRSHIWQLTLAKKRHHEREHS